MAGPSRRSPSDFLEGRYQTGGVPFLRRALLGQLALGLLVALVGALLTLLYADLSAADLAIIIALSELIYVADGALAIGPLRRGLEPLEAWSRNRDERSARAAWDALADLPFAPLRRLAPYVVVPLLVVLWDVVGVRRLGL